MEDIGSSIATEDYQFSVEDAVSSIATEDYQFSMEDAVSSIATEDYQFSIEDAVSSIATEDYQFSMEDTGSSIATEDYQFSMEDTGSSIAKEEYESSGEDIGSSIAAKSTMEDIVSIIAMKGHPFTRKTEIAKTIAASLPCPVLSYENFLAELPPPISPEREKELFLIICRMALDQLKAGMSVVIDSPLSSAWHLEQLTDLAEIADSLYSKNLRVIIIECKPTNAYSWSLKFEEHIRQRATNLELLAMCLSGIWGDVEEINPNHYEKSIRHDEFMSNLVLYHPGFFRPSMIKYKWISEAIKKMTHMSPSQMERVPWYKLKKWEDVQNASKNNPDYDEKSVQGHEYVSKFVVDPVFSRFSDESIVEAVKYMMTRHEGDGPDVVLFHQWRQLQSSSSTDLDCSKHGHNIVSISTVEEGLTVDCAFCEKRVMMSDYYYYCKGCSLALHKHCAESDSPKRTEDGKYACRTCKGKGEDFSDHCETCIVETHLSTRQSPTVISHVDTEEHLLTDKVLSKKIHEPDHCVVCGKFSGEWPILLCNICGLSYHYECATLPRRVNHEHGLHYHHLSLKFTSEEAEDYLCNQCNELRDPSLWFYSCEECPYELHPSCVKSDNVYRSDSSVADYSFDWGNYFFKVIFRTK